MSNLRIIFMGTPPLARASLAELLVAPWAQVVAVVTQPDRPKGRNLALQPSAVKELAAGSGLPVLQPAKVREPDFLASLRSFAPELIVVAAYGHILPSAILDLPRHGCLNIHTSLLPRYRGAAPIQWAIAQGETETGVTIMRMDAGMDTGDIVIQRPVPIAVEDNAQTLHDRLAQVGAETLLDCIPGYVSGAIVPRPQPATGASHAPKVKKEDGLVQWNLPARMIWNRLRAFTPWPGAFTHIPTTPQQRMLKLWRVEPLAGAGGRPGEILTAHGADLRVACGEGVLRVLELQPENGRRMTAGEFLAGHNLAPGAVLT